MLEYQCTAHEVVTGTFKPRLVHWNFRFDGQMEMNTVNKTKHIAQNAHCSHFSSNKNQTAKSFNGTIVMTFDICIMQPY